MCLDLGVNLGDIIRVRQAALSSQTVLILVASSQTMPKQVLNSFRTALIGSNSHIALDDAMYSASIVDSAISVCNLLVHSTGVVPKVMTYPVLDLTHEGSCTSS